METTHATVKDGNLCLSFSISTKSQRTDVWKILDWSFMFIQVPANSQISFRDLNVASSKEYSLVTIYGHFTNLPYTTRFAKPKQVRHSSISTDYSLQTGTENTIAILFWQDKPSTHALVKMEDSKLTGPHSEHLTWVNCETYNWGENFKNLEFYNLRGFKLHLQHEHNEKHIGYVQFWTAGKGVNCGLHNHSELKGENAFCEVHFGMHNGTNKGGMVYLENGKEISVPVLPGQEHGPFWNINEDGSPVMREDGSVVYPTHKWQAGGSKEDEQQAFDLWAAIEMIPSQSHCDSSL